MTKVRDHFLDQQEDKYILKYKIYSKKPITLRSVLKLEGDFLLAENSLKATFPNVAKLIIIVFALSRIMHSKK